MTAHPFTGPQAHEYLDLVTRRYIDLETWSDADLRGRAIARARRTLEGCMALARYRPLTPVVITAVALRWRPCWRSQDRAAGARLAWRSDQYRLVPCPAGQVQVVGLRLEVVVALEAEAQQGPGDDSPGPAKQS
ncbi:hypothetical protein ACFFMN_23975 [Planobispora siamensis]|uniref:Uncharacterized protein n=1 Tax=Planobispora siamensis TaxID=936338 RepID=A0A8J3SJ02_9ACTN|nr:hypothetical protein [Planobispora siamensis]GIH95396.1 hypothetical protein Psi01_60260 [Planobispora siamensis]